MTRRVRKPTARALDAAQSRLLEQAAFEERKRPPPSDPSHSHNSAAVKRKGRAVNAKGRTAVAKDQARASAQVTEEEQDQESEESEQQDQDEDQPDLTLYCVCLGYDTGEQPMIQCSYCTNWFHFGCIGLTEELAAQIESYACEMCQQMGVGGTKMLGNATIPPPIASTSKLANPLSKTHPEDQDADNDAQSQDGEDSGIDDENDEDPMGEDEDEDYGEEGSARKRRRGKQALARAGRAARRRKVEVDGDVGSDSFDEEDDQDDEDEEKPRSKGKGKSSSNRRTSSTPARPSTHTSDSKAASVPQTEKTRAAVVKQFTATFSSIYSASSNSDAEDVSHRATSFAQAVEEELFNGFYELDDKGIRAPRAKYTSKFRSLQFNLKTNAVFRSRIAHDEFNAAGIVNISAEDLQTPELKAMAESIRAASLKNSVKEALVAPTAKRTHKGEEEMENNSARLLAEEEAALKEMERKKSAEQKQREGSNSNSHADSPFPDESNPGGAFSGSPSPATPDPSADATSSEPFSRPRHRPSLTGSSSQVYENDLPESTRSPSLKQGSPFSPADSPFASSTTKREGRSHSPAVVKHEGEGEGAMSPPPQPRQRNSSTTIDMSAIWGKAKAASPSLEPETKEGGGPGGGDATMEGTGEEPPDIFNFEASKLGDEEDDDDFEKALFRSDGASPIKKTPRPAKTQPQAPPPRVPAISELPPVWAGDLIVTEEGGFPAFGVQIGGRPVGIDSKTWQRLLPRGLTTAGRISTLQASKYLVECCFAPTRELNIVALLPDTTGPSELFPHKPTGDRCLAKHNHIVNYYLNKDRIGVVQPPKELSTLVKDIYIIPLPKEHPLPEYVELLDEHFIPEPGKRDQDLLLCVLVLQKGVLPTVRIKPLAPSPTPPPASTSSSQQQQQQEPISFLSSSNFPNQSVLESLLSNPQTLSSLSTTESQSILNVANSQQSLPLSIPTGPRGGVGGTSGPPIHPSRLAALGGGIGNDNNAYGYQNYTSPPGPSRTTSSGGGIGGGGSFNSQTKHFENNLTNQGEYNDLYGGGGGIGDGGWANSGHGGGNSNRGGYNRGGGGGYRGRRSGYY
ncbi:hypothetical protein JCM3765_007070 [Sporobolomyces pararoseus]